MSRANEPATPCRTFETYVDGIRRDGRDFTGLTIREHVSIALLPSVYTHWRAHLTVEQVAAEAVQYADALIAELAKAKP